MLLTTLKNLIKAFDKGTCSPCGSNKIKYVGAYKDFVLIKFNNMSRKLFVNHFNLCKNILLLHSSINNSYV